MKFNNLEDRVSYAKDNAIERDLLISEYTPFIRKTINSVIFDSNKDYLTIGMMAFSDAIDSYQPGKGKFMVFAKVIIKNRVIDELRKADRNQTVELKDYMVTDNDEISLRKLEIDLFKELLENYSISFEGLISSSPKHKRTRESCKAVARLIREKEHLYEYFRKNGNLPVKETMKYIDVSDKIFERFRNYIIALILILDDRFGYLKDFIF
ncbi:MAG: RNA polymerase subunit sigma [Clostridia bacterium]|nr:RNA polymerase subunit sigma [Clostridia bacterium]